MNSYLESTAGRQMRARPMKKLQDVVDFHLKVDLFVSAVIEKTACTEIARRKGKA